mmetsp:Transcript_24962/g.63463  ORF Transcript_24962/g.63463 Transcript_24962/m.63463 type:complete len:547 (-) Transcript_24962:203-1843(-)
MLRAFFAVQPSSNQPPPPQRAPQSRPQARANATQSEVAAAVESLYEDQLKPYGRILRKRISEQSQAAGEEVDVSIKELRAMCESCTWLEVHDVEGADWAALIPGRASSFVDVYSPDDIYPEELWDLAAEYFGSMDNSTMVLPGGRYSCAQVLVQRDLPFLRGRSLGQVCHIVQLAISQKKLLGYLNGTVVPYSRSQSMVKEKNAECQRPCSSAVRGKSAVATWDMMHGCLQTLLSKVSGADQTLPLSNIKRLFRAQFQIELSETALGYAKLSELLQDQRLQDLCEVKLQGHGYVIVPIKKSTSRNLISLSDSLCMEGASPQNGADQLDSCTSQQIGSMSSSLCTDSIDIAEHLAKPYVAPPRVAMLSPRTLHARAVESGAPPYMPSVMTPARTPFGPTPSPGSVSVCPRSLPRLLGSIRTGPQALFGDVLKGNVRMLASSPMKAMMVSSPIKEYCGPVTPLRAQTATTLSSCASRDQATPLAQGTDAVYHAELKTQPWRPGPFTPSTLGKFGFSVHNTFIHAAMATPSPIRACAQFRARSVPRDTF